MNTYVYSLDAFHNLVAILGRLSLVIQLRSIKAISFFFKSNPEHYTFSCGCDCLKRYVLDQRIKDENLANYIYIFFDDSWLDKTRPMVSRLNGLFVTFYSLIIEMGLTCMNSPFVNVCFISWEMVTLEDIGGQDS